MATSKGNKGSGGAAGNAKTVTTIQHDDAKRKNIPTAEYQSVLEKQKLAPVRVSYPRAEAGAALSDEKQARNARRGMWDGAFIAPMRNESVP